MIVLLILIPAGLVAVALLGWSMCRLAGLSDDNQAVALAEWIAASYRTERRAAPGERTSEQHPFDSRGGAFRATG